ncbi:MAG: histidine kinase [Actinomycetota bacterium]
MTDERPELDDDTVSWPLVERRRSDVQPPDGVDRRRSRLPYVSPTLTAAPIWPFRVAALAGALIRSLSDTDDLDTKTIIFLTLGVVYTVTTSLLPVPNRDEPDIRKRIVLEQSLVTFAVLLTGAWGSPFVLFLVPTGMLAGFAAGELYSVYVAAAASVVITVQHVGVIGLGPALEDAALWAGLLLLVAFTTGLAHRAAHVAVTTHQVALDRVSRLSEANSLLFSLQRVAQTLPASLDLEEVLDSTVGRLRTLLDYDAMAVYLLDEGTRVMNPVRTSGVSGARSFRMGHLPRGLQMAIDSSRTVRLNQIAAGEGVGESSQSGVYGALRARGSLIGVIAVESDRADAFVNQQAEIVHGLGEPFGIAIDNARMFLSIGTLAADEERKRIARDLHDHVGSSLAMIGFEVDRVRQMAANGDDLEDVLAGLRQQVSAVVTEVRDTLYDLRTDVTDSRDLADTVREFLGRVEQRSGITTTCTLSLGTRMPIVIEREAWQIVREAVLNAERHSRGTNISVTGTRAGDNVTLVVRDNGVGLAAAKARPDSYGLTGMRERATRLDADLRIRSHPEGGTEMRLDFTGGTAD